LSTHKAIQTQARGYLLIQPILFLIWAHFLFLKCKIDYFDVLLKTYYGINCSKLLDLSNQNSYIPVPVISATVKAVFPTLVTAYVTPLVSNTIGNVEVVSEGIS